MKKKIIIFLVPAILIIAHEKEKKHKGLHPTEYFPILTNLKNFEKHKLNDSLYKVKGLFNNYAVKGYINDKNSRVSWWGTFDNRTKEQLEKVEYRPIGNKEFINQYILFENKNIDTLSSKFYTLNKKVNAISYKFYMHDHLKKIRSEGRLNYHIYSKGKGQAHVQCKCIKDKKFFNCKIFLPRNLAINSLTIRGDFQEIFQLENGSIQRNDIYVLDTLK